MQQPCALVVVGSLNVDLTFHLDAKAEWGETVSAHFTQSFGGKGANLASAAQQFGAPTLFIGAIGHDALGERAAADLDQRGVSHLLHVNDDIPTGTAGIVVRPDGENLIALDPGANRHLDRTFVRRALKEVAARHGSMLVATNFETARPAIEEVFAQKDALSIRVLLDPAPAPTEEWMVQLCMHADILTPNLHESESLEASPSFDRTRFLAMGGRYLLTRGSRGAQLATGDSVFEVSAPPVEVVDTTGAGDTLAGIFAASLTRGDREDEALRAAVYGAALATTERGARGHLPTAQEVAAFMMS
jgi:ribokinase